MPKTFGQLLGPEFLSLLNEGEVSLRGANEGAIAKLMAERGSQYVQEVSFSPELLNDDDKSLPAVFGMVSLVDFNLWHLSTLMHTGDLPMTTSASFAVVMTRKGSEEAAVSVPVHVEPQALFRCLDEGVRTPIVNECMDLRRYLPDLTALQDFESIHFAIIEDISSDREQEWQEWDYVFPAEKELPAYELSL